MRTIFEIWTLVDGFLLSGIFVSVLVIILTKYILKNKVNIETSLNIIRITLIIHSVVFIFIFITSFLFQELDVSFWIRAFGPHWWAYWLMLTMNVFLPLTLMIKKLGSRKIYLLLVAVLMNIGRIFESFVIHITSMEREYINEDYNPYLPTSAELSTLVNGVIIGILILIAGNLLKEKKELVK